MATLHENLPMEPKTVVISIDASAHSVAALRWSLQNVWREGDALHLITVMHPLTLGAYPVTPVVTSASVTAIVQQTELQRRHEESEAKRVLSDALEQAVARDIERQSVHTHVLPAAGGASGVAESIVEYAKAIQADVVVVGSRGLGSFQRSMMSLVGLGSVSDYCVHNLPCPIIVMKAPAHAAQNGTAPNGTRAPEAQEPAPAAPRTVLLAPDSSEPSQAAMEWALKSLLRQQDHVHIISVALPQPFPVLDEGSATIAAMEAEEWRRSNTEALADAQLVTERVAQHIVHSGVVPPEAIWQRALTPQGGASDVGATICNYAKDVKADLLVLGSRGLGAFKRSMLGLVGLGSVSDYCVHQLHCPVVIVKGKGSKVAEWPYEGGEEEQAGAQAEQEERAPAAEAAASGKQE